MNILVNMKERLSIVYRFETITVRWMIDGLSAILREHGLPTTGYELYGQPSALESVPRRSRKREVFFLSGPDFLLSLARVANYQMDVFEVEAADPERIPWAEWVSPLARTPSFVVARASNVEYESWQNTDDIGIYERAGREHLHLPRRLNGLPPPLERIVIDTSKNPGRMVLRQGYYEAVGAKMWLGKPFFSLTGASLDAVLSTPWLKCVWSQPDVLFIEAAEALFDSDAPESAALQNKLRDLLFPAWAA